MERPLYEHFPDPVTFSRHFALVQAYVASQPGSREGLMTAAHDDPEGMTTSIIALGGVLLDIAAGAFKLTPEEMLDKIAAGVADVTTEASA